MIKYFLSIEIIFLAGISLSFSSARAFTLVRSGSGVTNTGWVGTSVTFDIDPSCDAYGSFVNAAINTASDVWGKVPNSSLTVNLGVASALPQAITHYVGNAADSYSPNGNAIVYCDTNFSTTSGLDANSIPGFATGQNITSSGTIQGCLLVLNVQSGGRASITSLSSEVVNNVLTHEIGHCLGLGHSSEPNSLMYYSTGQGRGTYLSQDDIDGVTYLYPKQDVSSGFKGCSAIAANGPPRFFHRNPLVSLFHYFGADIFLVFIFIGLNFYFRKIRRRGIE